MLLPNLTKHYGTGQELRTLDYVSELDNCWAGVLPAQLSLRAMNSSREQPMLVMPLLEKLNTGNAIYKAYALQSLEPEYYNIFAEIPQLFDLLEIWHPMPEEFLPELLTRKGKLKHFRWDLYGHKFTCLDSFTHAITNGKALHFTEDSSVRQPYTKGTASNAICHLHEKPWYDEAFWRAISNNCAVLVPNSLAKYLPEYKNHCPELFFEDSFAPHVFVKLLDSMMFDAKFSSRITGYNYKLITEGF